MTHLKEQTNATFDPQDLRTMGGLRHHMPKTFVLMVIASLALAGFPLTSGYLSKDSIVISAFEWASQYGGLYFIVPTFLIFVSILTAFYIGRLLFKAFLVHTIIRLRYTMHPRRCFTPCCSWVAVVCSLHSLGNRSITTPHGLWKLFT